MAEPQLGNKSSNVHTPFTNVRPPSPKLCTLHTSGNYLKSGRFDFTLTPVDCSCARVVAIFSGIVSVWSHSNYPVKVGINKKVMFFAN